MPAINPEPEFKVPPKEIIDAEINPHKSFLMRHIVAEVLALAFVVALGAAGYYWQTSRIQAPVFEPIKHDSTAKWKTYTNTDYGFEFKYPGDWELKALDSNMISLRSKEDKDQIGGSINYGPSNPISLQIFKNTSGSNLIEWFDGEYDEVEVISKKNLKINNQDVIEAELVGEHSSISTFFGSSKYIVEYNTPTNTIYKKIYNQILSTFKFIEPVAKINSFDSCIAAGNPMMKSYPAKCATSDGVTFVQVIGACVQVIQPAKNPKTGEVRDFPTPCDVPEGWVKVTNSGT